MNIYILLSIIFLLLVTAYLSCKRDIMAPSVLLTAGYMMSCISCIYNIGNWGVELQFYTCFLIVLGIVSFQLGDFIHNSTHRQKLFSSNEITQATEIKISNFVILFFILYNLVVLYLSIREILTMASGLQTTLGNAIGQFRNAYSYTDFRVNTLNVQLFKVSRGAAYIFAYVFFNNIFAKKKSIMRNIKYIIPIVTYALITLTRGGRTNAIMMLIAMLFLFYYHWHKKVGWNRNVSIKFVKWIFVALVAFSILFFGTRELVGRKETTPFLEYLTTYIGGSYQLLDQYLKDGSFISDNLETFPGIIQSLEKMGILASSFHKSLEFRYSPTGVYLGNVYTGLRRYYHDFGIPGIIIIQLLYGYLFSAMYSKIKKMRFMDSGRAFFVTTYSSILFCIMTQSIEDHFWIDLSLGFVVELFVAYIITKVIMDYQFQGKLRIRHHKWSEKEHLIPKDR